MQLRVDMDYTGGRMPQTEFARKCLGQIVNILLIGSFVWIWYGGSLFGQPILPAATATPGSLPDIPAAMETPALVVMTPTSSPIPTSSAVVPAATATPAPVVMTPTPLVIPTPPQQQVDAYHARLPKTAIELQQFRTTSSIPILNNSGETGIATLINLNPQINSWFLLTLEWSQRKQKQMYHLENNNPTTQQLLLNPQYQSGLLIEVEGRKYACNLWSSIPVSVIEAAQASNQVYAPMCNQRISLRNKTAGHKTTKEWATDFLRTYVPGGEKVTEIVKGTLYQDAFLNTSDLVTSQQPQQASQADLPGWPLRPLVNPLYEQVSLVVSEVGLEVASEEKNKVVVGRWYQVKDNPGIFFSAIQPKLIAAEVVQSQQKLVNAIDDVEANALVYNVAFDLNRFEVGFAMGTEHPRVDWSDRVPENVRNASLPGPDGIGTVAPLTITGMVNPINAERIAATFVGGFRRYHGAFRVGELATKYHGSHYGFIEQGVVLSKMIPELATLIVWNTGAVDLKTWTADDEKRLALIRFARQNGVPIIDYDPATGVSKPGKYVPRTSGSWSGSVEGNIRTLRSGLAIQETNTARFLIFGYFSTATPSAMARVFAAYRSKYAMLLDINALEHTYLAVYTNVGEQFRVQHLMKGMAAVDKSNKGSVAPRFIGYADNRDFFYLLRKQEGKP